MGYERGVRLSSDGASKEARGRRWFGAPEVEKVAAGRYYRTARYKDAVGETSVSFDDGTSVLRVRVSHSLNSYLVGVVSGVRRLFDAEADVGIITKHLPRDPKTRMAM
jgi:hypothetical protein